MKSLYRQAIFYIVKKILILVKNSLDRCCSMCVEFHKINYTKTGESDVRI